MVNVSGGINLLFLIFFFFSFLIGVLFALKPVFSIELQKKFYASINWRIEPISLGKEIRNTRIMGSFLIILSIFGGIFIVNSFFY